MSWVALLGAPLALHLLLRTGSPDERHRGPWWAELVLALLAGLLGAWALAFVRYDDFVSAGVYTSSDFTEYCSIVSELRSGVWPEHSQRSLLAGWPSAKLAGDGLLQGMALAGLGSIALFCTGVYLWARSLAGPLAGLAAVALCSALAPLAMLSHDLSFYPEAVAVFTLGAAACAAALRWRSWRTSLLLGLAVAACLLVDVKGLAWALSFAGLGVLAALSQPRRAPARLLALLLPIALSYPVGRVANPVYAISLEGQANIEARIEKDGVVFDDSYLRWDSNFLWGRSNPLEIPKTLHTVWAQSAGIDLDSLGSDEGDRRWETLVGGLGTPFTAALAGLALVLARRRDPWFALALVGTAVPFAVALEGAVVMHQSFPRHLSTGLPFAVVWGGVAWSGLLDGWRAPEPVRRSLRPLLGLALLGAVLLGRLPTGLAVEADWRERISAENMDIRRLLERRSDGETPRERSCLRALDQDRRQGRAVRGTLYGGEPERAREGD